MDTKTKVICSLEDFQKVVDQFLEEVLMGIDYYQPNEETEVRFIKSDGSFGYGSECDLFVYQDKLYYWTQDKDAKDYMTLSDFQLYDKLQYMIVFADMKIYPVIFAGVYTGYMDDKGKRIYTGDVVKATITVTADQPSAGGKSRAWMTNGKEIQGFSTIVGVNSFMDRTDDYYYILDNSPVPMRYTKKVRIIGNVFYDLDRDNPSVDIASRCATLAFPYKKNVRNLHIKIAHAPYFAGKTWQEKAMMVLLDEPIYEDLPIDD